SDGSARPPFFPRYAVAPPANRQLPARHDFSGPNMKISIFGLGYVGCVSAACFADKGHEVFGVDINQTKVEIINSGRSPIVLPGTIEQTVIPILEVYSGKRAGRDFGVAINPEFLREGTSIHDFNHPPFTLIGADDEDTAGLLRRLYIDTDAQTIVIGIKEAEMIKYACNCFHALKVTFANEIGNICKSL